MCAPPAAASDVSIYSGCGRSSFSGWHDSSGCLRVLILPLVVVRNGAIRTAVYKYTAMDHGVAPECQPQFCGPNTTRITFFS